MQKDFWLDRWENQQIGFHQANVNSSLINHWSLIDAPDEGRVFVPLCGKSIDLVWLANQGYKVVAVEFSQLAVEAFFAEQNLTYELLTDGKLASYTSGNISIFQGDFFDLNASMLGTINAVFDRASLIALPEDMRRRYCEHMQVITNKASMLLVTMEYDQAVMNGPPFSVAESELDQRYSNHYLINQLDAVDLLATSPQFKERGLESLVEKVYKLTALVSS